MNRQERIEDILTKHLSPVYLSVENMSHNHRHHTGDDGSGQTHYDIAVSSAVFNNLNAVARQRLVNNLLADEFKTGLHALSMHLDGA